MRFPESDTVTCVLFVTFLVIFVPCGILRRRKRQCLPPGPKAFPLIGNLFDFPRSNIGHEMADLSSKYGDVTYLCIFGQPIIILGGYEAAHELLHKRSVNYSDGLQPIMAEVVGVECMLGLRKYGTEWKEERRTFHQTLIAQASDYYPIQLEGARKFLLAMLESPTNAVKQVEFVFDSTVLKVIYGIDVSRKDDKYHCMAERALAIIEDVTTPGKHFEEALPFLFRLYSWIPGGKLRQYGEQAKTEVQNILDTLSQAGKDNMHMNTGRNSVFCRLFHDSGTLSAFEISKLERMCAVVGFTSYLGGTGTTNASLSAFFLAMAIYPDVQRKAQAELDRVVGSGQLPDFSDRNKLPYMNAVVKELHRWHIATPFGIPHRSEAEDVYEGYIIPAGSLILSNLWLMSRNEEKYPDPERFIPERFLDSSGQLDLSAGDPEDFVFGFGRRICPGRNFADSSIFIFCASILWAFNIEPPLDEHGDPVKMEHTGDSASIVTHPEVYEFRLECRSSQAEKVIKG